MRKKDFFSYIQGEEHKRKMENLLDKIDICERKQTIEYTDFFDPYDVELSGHILNQYKDINCLFTNGLEYGERKIGILYPVFYSGLVKPVEDYISVLKIESNGLELSHSDCLGAILNLGISRDKIGDIFPVGDKAFVLATKPISSFILSQLYRIRHVPVKVTEADFHEVERKEEEVHSQLVSLASLRLDLIISSAFRISREESSRLISSGDVKVQWKAVYKREEVLEPGMMISVRRYGRIYFEEVLGTSSKGKIRIRLSIV